MLSSVVKWWLGLFVIAILAIATLFSIQNIERFYISSGQKIVDPLFLDGLAHWQKNGHGLVSFSGKQLSVVNVGLETTKLVQRVEVNAPGYFRLSLEGGGSDIIKGRRASDLGAVVVVYRSPLNRFLSSNTVMSIYGTRALRRYQREMYIGKDVQAVDIEVRLLRSSGELNVKNLTFTQISEYPAYKWLVRIVAAVWAVTLFLVLMVLFRVLEFRSLVIFTALIGFICIGTLLPGNLISTIAQMIGGFVPESVFSLLSAVLALFFGAEGFADRGAELSKLGHMVAFFLLGLCLAWGRWGGEILYAVCVIVVLAFLTEVLQTLSLVRTGSVVDFNLDAVFGLLGAAVGAFGGMVWKARKLG